MLPESIEKTRAELTRMSDPQLTNMAAQMSRSGSPGALFVAMEMKRRADIRNGANAAQAPQETVVDQLVQQLSAPPMPPQGLATLPPQMAMPPQMPPGMAMPPQTPPPQAMPPQMPPGMAMPPQMPPPQAMPQMQGGGHVHDYGVATLPYEPRYEEGGIVSFVGGGNKGLDDGLYSGQSFEGYDPDDLYQMLAELETPTVEEPSRVIRAGLVAFPEKDITAAVNDYFGKEKNTSSNVEPKLERNDIPPEVLETPSVGGRAGLDRARERLAQEAAEREAMLEKHRENLVPKQSWGAPPSEENLAKFREIIAKGEKPLPSSKSGRYNDMSPAEQVAMDVNMQSAADKLTAPKAKSSYPFAGFSITEVDDTAPAPSSPYADLLTKLEAFGGGSQGATGITEPPKVSYTRPYTDKDLNPENIVKESKKFDELAKVDPEFFEKMLKQYEQEKTDLATKAGPKNWLGLANAFLTMAQTPGSFGAGLAAGMGKGIENLKANVKEREDKEDKIRESQRLLLVQQDAARRGDAKTWQTALEARKKINQEIGLKEQQDQFTRDTDIYKTKMQSADTASTNARAYDVAKLTAMSGIEQERIKAENASREKALDRLNRMQIALERNKIAVARMGSLERLAHNKALQDVEKNIPLNGSEVRNQLLSERQARIPGYTMDMLLEEMKQNRVPQEVMVAARKKIAEMVVDTQRQMQMNPNYGTGNLFDPSSIGEYLSPTTPVP